MSFVGKLIGISSGYGGSRCFSPFEAPLYEPPQVNVQASTYVWASVLTKPDSEDPAVQRFVCGDALPECCLLGVGPPACLVEDQCSA